MLRTPISARNRSSGVVLILALLMLVVMTLAAIALTRSVSTSNAIAGNLAFQQAATASANVGTEAAIAWLENNTGQTTGTSTATACPAGPVPETTVLACDQNVVTSGSHQGYIAHRQDPTSGVSWMDFWNSSLSQYAVNLPADAAGNTVSYVVQRLCSGAGDPGSPGLQCTATPVLVGGGAGSCAATGSNCNSGSSNLNSVASQVYYRITVQVAGPRNTQSMTQTVVAM